MSSRGGEGEESMERKKMEIDAGKLEERKRMEEEERGDKGSTEQVDLTEVDCSNLKGDLETTGSEKFISTLAKTVKTISVKRMVAALEGTEQELKLNPQSKYNFAGLEGPALGSPAKRRRTCQSVPSSPPPPGPRTLGGPTTPSTGYATATSSSPGPRWRRTRGSTGTRTPRKGGCPSPRPVSTLTRGTGSSVSRGTPSTPCPSQNLAKKVSSSQTGNISPEKFSLCQERGPTLAPSGRTFSVLNTRTLPVKPVQGCHHALAGQALGAVHHPHQPDHLLLHHQGGHQYGSACPPEVMTGTSASSSSTSRRNTSSEKGGVLELRKSFIQASSEQSQTQSSSSSTTTHLNSSSSTVTTTRRLPTATGRGATCTSTSTTSSSTPTTGRKSTNVTGTHTPTATPSTSSRSPQSILSRQVSSLPWGQEPGARPWPTGTRGVCPSSPSSGGLIRSGRSPGRSRSLDIISVGEGEQIRGQKEQTIVPLYEQQAKYPARLPLTVFCPANSTEGGGKTTDPLLHSTETERTNERAATVTDRGGGQGLVENNIN